MCFCLSVSKGRMQSGDANFINRSEGRWQMALWGACDTGVSEPAGEHMKGRLCRRAASGRQQGCDEVRLVA